MPGEVIDRPNPLPLPSSIPEDVLSLAVKLEKSKLDEALYDGLQQFRRAANYIAAGKPINEQKPSLHADNSK